MVFSDNQNQTKKATWIWDVSKIEEDPEQAVSFLKDEKVNLVYIHIDFETFRPGPYRSFIQHASKEGIDVYALGGDPNWALIKNRDSLDHFVSIVHDYNNTVGEDQKFAGVHVDIEPYLLSQWKEDADNVINQWMMNTVHLIREAKEQDHLQVSGDFPFWIHEKKVPYKDQTLSEWMIEHYDSMTLMAYRNKSEGPNGIQSISKPIVNEASKEGKSVIVGVNVIDSAEGAHTTFHGDEPGTMSQELEVLEDAYKGNKGFGGTAIHDYSHWIDHAD